VLQKIVYAGSNNPSFQRGSQDLRVLAKLTVPVKQVERLTKQIGRERHAERDEAVKAWRSRPLAQREDPPAGVTPVAVAVVEMDGGRLQIRAPEAGPDATAAVTPAGGLADSAPQSPTAPPQAGAAATTAALPPAADATPARAAKAKHWREHKTGCLLEMSSQLSAVDPCPDIPAVFVDPLRALALAQDIGHCAVPPGAPFKKAEPEVEEPAAADDATPQRPGRPDLERRRVVASRQDVYGFGPILASAAWAMGLFSAARRAFVADGLAENWSVYRRYFSRFTAVLDFIHALTYVYAAAMAGRTFAEGWPVYERWIRWVWGGQVRPVLGALAARQQEVGVATEEDKEGSPRRTVQETLTYLTNHQDKMHYDEYRRQGLPLMSSHVESTIKQLNYRVKGTEKFWSEAGAEALLQLRADHLSGDEPLVEFWERRQGAATGQRPYRRRSA
jgi:hypothetical protein